MVNPMVDSVVRALTPLLCVALLLPACRAQTPEGRDDPDAAPTALAERPGTLPSNLPTPGKGGSDDKGPGPTRSGHAGPGDDGDGGTAAFRTIGSTEDTDGDAGAEAPGYVDLLGIVIEDDGHSARLTVRMDGSVPQRMDGGEQMAIGVDLYKRNTTESDYQVYAQGTEDGWLAYLTTPDGLVEYPGRFALGGARLVFTVPWSALDGIRGTRFSAYSDWDRERPVLNQVGADRAPGRGTAAFSR